MLRTLIRCGALAGAIGLGACDLIVTNPNNPETKRVLASPADVESLLGTEFLRWHIAMHGSTGNQWGMAAVQALENFSSLSNNCLGQRVSIPRAANDNQPGNSCNGEQARVYNIEHEVSRITTSILNKFADPDFNLGAPGTNRRNLRAKAFAHFVRGLAVGYIALFYDSGAVVTPEMGPEDGGVLESYQVLMDSALANLQKAIDYASTPAGDLTGPTSDGFPLPATWVPSPTTMNATEFIKVVRTFRARLRANVARTPAERAAVDWDAVIADAQNGVTADFNLTTNSSSGPFNSWVDQFMTFTTWHQMTPFVIGMADGSDGAYQAWLQLPLLDRGNGSETFFMVTPDTRFPQGATRTAQQADFALSSCSNANTVCKRYFVNRPTGNDLKSGPSWGYSNYDHVRFYQWAKAGTSTARNGPFPFFTKAELDMLQAEGQYRKGNFAAAGALVNITRTRAGTATQPGGGLPAITVFDATTPVPGGASCVPKIPVGPSYTTVACGNLWEALKYEKRIETAYSHFAAWFLDMRGWGDLPEGTGTDWPVPYQDLQARSSGSEQHPIYSTGGSGAGNTHTAERGTYGW